MLPPNFSNNQMVPTHSQISNRTSHNNSSNRKININNMVNNNSNSNDSSNSHSNSNTNFGPRGISTNKMDNAHMDQQSSSPLSSSMSASSSLLPPSGFSPPMNLHHRKPSKTSTVITANANNRSLSSESASISISASTSSVLSSPRLTRSSTKITRQQNGDIRILGGGGRCSSSGTNTGTRTRTMEQSDEQENGFLRQGTTPSIASITADLDLAATEEQQLKEIDAAVEACVNNAVTDHDDVDELGFHFAPSPKRNDGMLALRNNSTPKTSSSTSSSSQKIGVGGGTFDAESATPLKIQSSPAHSLPMPSPPQPPTFREPQMKQQNRHHHQQQQHQQRRSTQHPNHHHPAYHQFATPGPFAPFPPRGYVNNRQIPPKMKQEKYYGHNMSYRPGNQVLPPSQIAIDPMYKPQRPPPSSFPASHPASQQYYHQMHPNHTGKVKTRSSESSSTSRDMMMKKDTDRPTKKSCTLLSSPQHNKENVHIGLDTSCDKKIASNLEGDKIIRNKTLLRSPPPKKRRYEDIHIGSPGDVFRSPKIQMSPKSHMKRSPQFSLKDTVSFGASFDIEASPHSKFEDMFPPSNSFDICDSNKLLLSRSPLSRSPLSRTMSGDDRDLHFRRIHGSPGLMFKDVMSPYRSSPVTKRTDSILGVFDASPIPSRPLKRKHDKDNKSIAIPTLPSSKKSSDSGEGSNRIRRSPMENGPHPSFTSPGTTFRLQIGTIGGSGSRREIEGINSIVNRRPQVGHLNLDHNQSNTETPIKAASRLVSTPSTGVRISYPGSGQRRLHHAPEYMGSTIPEPRPRYINTAVTPAKSKDGKENASPTQRRNPCNCKKSNCLKLYCVCFQSKQYCDGCNCNDCNNTKEKEDIRMKAIKDTIAKNPNAFKPRFSSKQESIKNGGCDPSPLKGHNMGCRCKKSQCLKKYCECFEAGVICSDKCKCIECQNFIGSQQLIDRRRKIKDHKGAEMAMRSSHDAWKHGMGHNMRHGMPLPTVYPSPAPRIGQPPMGIYSMFSPPSVGMRPGSMPPGSMPHGSMPPHFMGRSQMIMAPMGYSPIGMQPVTPAYSTSGNSHHRSGGGRDKNFLPTPHYQQRPQQRHHQHQPMSPKMSTTKNPAARKGFNPHSVKKKNGKREMTKHYFGPTNAPQTKTTALTIFSFLSNDDIYNASLVSHAWSKLSLDEELWQFEETS